MNAIDTPARVPSSAARGVILRMMGAQAFQETPKTHAPAIILSLMPHLAAWGKLMIDNSLAAAGTSAAAVGFDKLGQTGVLYSGLAVLGEGAILSGLILAAVAAFVIDREFMKAGSFALAGAVLTFFGFMHSEAIGIARTPVVAFSYLAVGVGLMVYARMTVSTRVKLPLPDLHGAVAAE